MGNVEKQTRFSKEEELEICEKYKNGKNVIPLAKEYETTISLIYEIFKRNGVQLDRSRGRTDGLSKEEQIQLCEEYKGGCDMTTLHEKYKLTKPGMYDILKRNGYETWTAIRKRERN